MKTGLIIHGTPDKEEYYSDAYPSCSNSHWTSWLQKQMCIQDILTQSLEMPKAYWPNYTNWREMLERFTIDENTILIGHSCGGGFLLRYFSENKIPVKRIVLVAPWLDPDQNKDPDFFNFEIDPNLTERTDLHMFYSDNDMESIQTSVKTIHSKIPDIHSREFKSYGHFCLGDMGTDQFPELRDIVIK